MLEQQRIMWNTNTLPISKSIFKLFFLGMDRYIACLQKLHRWGNLADLANKSFEEWNFTFYMSSVVVFIICYYDDASHFVQGNLSYLHFL